MDKLQKLFNAIREAGGHHPQIIACDHRENCTIVVFKVLVKNVDQPLEIPA